MKKVFAFIVTLLLCVNIFAQHSKVLFIGNSYTSVNNLPELISNIFTSTGDTLLYEMSAPGGCTFQQHCNVSMPYIQQGGWDYVVLQEQSQLPSFPESQFMQESYPYAHQLCEAIQQYNPDAQTVFYMTWGRKNGDAQNCPYYPPLCTYEGMDSLLYARYMMLAKDNHACVSPVGAAWHYVRDHYPQIELYQSDESHPSYMGSYIAACCFYTYFTQQNPMNITWNSTLDAELANLAKLAVKAVVYDSLSKWCFPEDTVPDDSTAVNDVISDSFLVYPNPANNTLRIHASNVTGFFSLKMVDLMGNIVYQKTGVVSDEVFDVSSFPNGVYLVRLSNGQCHYTKTITINH